jgi:pimeloyl-ACP methyl ester carboxylesterase
MESDLPKELAVNELIGRYSRGYRRVAALRQLPLGLLEFAGLLVSPVFWTAKLLRGDGHSIIAIPGYGGGDWYLSTLRNWLRRVGYRAVGSGINANPGWSEQIVDHLSRLVGEELARSQRRVTLIGHSLGGLQARSVAQRLPHAVGRLIALGAPFAYAGGEIPDTVAITSIYTASDLAYEPQAREPHAENIEVRGTHNGLAANRRVYRLLAELLAREDTRT